MGQINHRTPGILKPALTAGRRLKADHKTENPKTTSAHLNQIEQESPAPDQVKTDHPAALSLLGLILEQQDEIERLEERIDRLEERLLMEISNTPPRFIPP